MPYYYSNAQAERKHAPSGYSDYADFRPWLRDEFQFRCAYCLFRETWGRVGHTRSFHIDHALPKSKHPDKSKLYENLVYCCDWCNYLKSDEEFVPSPVDFVNSGHLSVNEDGSLSFSDDPVVKDFVAKLGLNSDYKRAERRKFLEDHTVLFERRRISEYDNRRFLEDFGFPEDLPDLLNLDKAPKANAKPEGAVHCFHELRKQSSLPESYC